MFVTFVFHFCCSFKSNPTAVGYAVMHLCSRSGQPSLHVELSFLFSFSFFTLVFNSILLRLLTPCFSLSLSLSPCSFSSFILAGWCTEVIERWDGLPIATTPPAPPSYWAAWCKHKADCSLQNAWACSRQLECSRLAPPPRLPFPLAPSSTAIAAPAVLVPPSWIWVSFGPLAEA